MDSGRPSISGVGNEIASRAVPGTKPRGSPRPGAEEERAVAVACSVAGVDASETGSESSDAEGGRIRAARTKVDDPERARGGRGRTDRSRGRVMGRSSFGCSGVGRGARTKAATGRGTRMTALPLGQSASTRWTGGRHRRAAAGRGISGKLGLSYKALKLVKRAWLRITPGGAASG
jgi:hypothetical protein